MEPYQPPRFDSAISATPAFANAPPPVYRPFNFPGMPGGAVGQLAMPILAQSLMGPNMVPSQTFGSQGFYDTLAAKTYQQNNDLAMQMASKHEARGIGATIVGAQTVWSGQAPTAVQRQQAFAMGTMIQNALPMATKILGPGMVDAMTGGRSATVMAGGMHRGMRSMRDPVTGAMGVSGRSAGQIATETYEQLYGAGTTMGDMRGLGSAMSTATFEEMSMRGLMGGGPQSTEARLRSIAATKFDERTMRRVAENSLRAKGNVDFTTSDVRAETSGIFGQRGPGGQRNPGANTTMGKLRSAVANEGADGLDTQALQQLGGTNELLTAGAAQRITGSLKNMAGSVAAMRDIFGDMGQPNAPMREIINGLEALTQGGIATMSPGRVEQMVRTTKNLAQTSGLGIQGMLGLQAQSANLGDQLGLNRGFAVQAAQGAAAFATVARQAGIRGYGTASVEKQAVMEVQLQTRAAASQTNNMISATIRMEELGLLKEGSEMSRMAQAAMKKQTSWTDADGNKRGMGMTNAAWATMATGSGATRAGAMSALGDKYGNQRYGLEHNTIAITRKLQAKLDFEDPMQRVFANAIDAQMNASEDMKGMLGERDIAAVGRRMAQNFFTTSAEDRGEDPFVNRALSLQREIAQQVRNNGGDEAAVDAAMARLGPVGKDGIRMGARRIANQMTGDLGRRITTGGGAMGGYENEGVLYQMQNTTTLARAGAVQAEAQTTARIQSDYAKLTRSGPAQRVIRALQNATPETTFADIARAGAGGIDRADINALETSAFGSMRSLRSSISGLERHTEASARAAAMTSLNVDAAALVANPRLASEVDSVARGLLPQLTARGKRRHGVLALASTGLTDGNEAATTALDAIARSEIGEDAVSGDLTKEFWKAGIANAKTDIEKNRLRQMQNIVGGLRKAREGRTAPKALEEVYAAEDGFIPDPEVAGEGGEIGASGKVQRGGQRGANAGGGGGPFRISGTVRLIDADKLQLAGEIETGDVDNAGVQTDVTGIS